MKIGFAVPGALPASSTRSAPAPPALPSICIVAHFAYGTMTGGRSGHIGGVEWQTSLTAKWLAAKGYPVSMLTWNEGGPAEEQIEGVRVITMCKKEAGLAGWRFFHPRWSTLIQAMRRANADVYYHNCGEAITGQIALWCRMNGRGFVFSSANDTDCDPALPEFTAHRVRLLYRYGIRHADRLIVQTATQRRMLKEGFGLEATVIPMPCLGQPKQDFVPRFKPPSHRVLWIGRIWIQKRPDLFLDVAEACPDLEFDFVGPSFDTVYSQEVLKRAKAMRNITVHGRIPRNRVAELYQQAGCFCSTSDYEGFPNTFLESWSYGVPIVSRFDPDSRIADQRLGIVAQDTKGIINGIRKLFESPDCYRQASLNARRYYDRNHTVEATMPQFEKVFCSAARKKS